MKGAALSIQHQSVSSTSQLGKKPQNTFSAETWLLLLSDSGWFAVACLTLRFQAGCSVMVPNKRSRVGEIPLACCAVSTLVRATHRPLESCAVRALCTGSVDTSIVLS